MGRRSTGAPVLVTIYWRDIPAQVNGQMGRQRHQVVLSAKFQRAIDRAKRKANIYTAEDDIAQWRRVSAPCDADIARAAQVEADRIEHEHSREYLGKLAFAGGFVADVDDADVDRVSLLALEELDDDADEHDDMDGVSESALNETTVNETTVNESTMNEGTWR